MIGQFFSRKGTSNPATSPAPTATLDSATEESHTRHLLYPDSSTLFHPDGLPYPLHAAPLTPGSGHDGPLPEIDLEFPRDVRIIIAQDDFAHMAKTVLFDSKPGPPRAESPAHSRTRAFGGTSTAAAGTAGPTLGGLHARRTSLVAEPTPRSPAVSGFTRTRTRGASISSMPNIDEHAQIQAQAQAQARARESSDLVNTCLECMFGSTSMTYRGNSNKMHIVPLDTKPEATVLGPSIHEVSGSLGRGDGFRRRSNLANSFTPSNLPTDLPRADSNEGVLKEPKRRTIFITRMFSVPSPDDSTEARTSTNAPSTQPQGGGFPFPQANPNAKAGPQKPTHLNQPRKTPMYAITIILHLPIAPTSNPRAAPKTPGHFSTSAPGQDSLASSLDSDRRAGWAFVDSNLGGDALVSSALSSHVDDRVDVVGQHWDVIMRALTSLQHVVQERISAHYKAPVAMSPPDQPQHRRAPSRASLREGPPPLGRRPPLRLQPNALMLDKEIQAAAELTGNRVVSGMRIPRVMTGQGKWGVWREEARWLGKWAGKREQNFFFFNLLTAFLGNHTEWLSILGPKWARKRHREQLKATVGENIVIPTRTVIVSPDKMAARRLIFLLAAFLPPNSPVISDAVNIARPGTSASLRAYSQSPPTNMPPSRKQSLRRQINRRPREKQSMTSIRLQPPTSSKADATSSGTSHQRSVSAVVEFPDVMKPPTHSRRSSTHSIRTSLVLPSMSDGTALSKNTVLSPSTAAPQSAIPIAHFTLPRTRSGGPIADHRPETSDSLASANLINTLHRSGTGQTSLESNDSSNNSRWSGFINFWSGGRRDSSTDGSNYLQTTDDGVGFRGLERPRSHLEQMVRESQELTLEEGVFEEGEPYETPGTSANSAIKVASETFPISRSSGIPVSAARPIPERPKTYDSQLKLSVNEKDGVIDVDIALPDFGSPLQSPIFGGAGSVGSQHGSSFGESSILSMPFNEPEQPVNAAGWLSQFHPDFAIQAIKPYATLEREIKRAMSAEPTPITSATTPSVETGPLERWVDVCSALVADTRTFSIKRLSLRRLVRLIPAPTYQPTALTPGVAGMPPGRSQYGNPYTFSPVAPMPTEIHLAEKFDEEAIMDFDAVLIEGIDRVLARSGDITRVNSNQSSRSSSRRGRRDTRADSDVTGVGRGAHVEVSQTDCKGVIFDALETVVKNVTAERSTEKEAEGGEEKSVRTVNQRTYTHSSLKEGVRRWLSEVE
ncbi:uncharacterized protein M421DRAFT_92699 [Didymella exigua CBS 183.55]|uniref:Folliculin-interacting protein N-terminal domain-containing protein n=1 Tax=Didymella exigua CBS 183.55 TaxID=1150837 RepID=A0A6A5RK32_9PLEO|nr:uncharacterized protein M421DRAFT_92699 [Didymella exigua CBS 183.55]KAF1927823.1 hypothetical protein M421DRAFT_92699 [Didymella exigua CBS 183.55]